MVTVANEMTDRTSPTDPCDCITVSVTSTGNCADTLPAHLNTDGNGVINAAEVIMYTLYIKI